MPATSASGIIDVVRSRVDNTALSDTQILEMINTGKRSMQRRFPLRWQETFSTAQSLATPSSASTFRSFTLPADLKVIRAVYTIESSVYGLVKHDPDFIGLVNNRTLPTSAALPSFWTHWGNAGYLFPANSGTITIQLFYEKMLADYTSLSATDDFITYAPEVLEHETTAEYYDTIFETDKAQVWHAKAERAMQLVLGQHVTDDERRPNPVAIATATSVAGIVDRVRLGVQNSSFSDTAILNFINNAKRTIQRRFPLWWQETYQTGISLSVPAAGTPYRVFSLPSDRKTVVSVHFVESGTYKAIPYDGNFKDIVSELTGATASTHPEYWAQWGGTGYIFPPNSVTWEILIFYEKMLADYTSLAGTDDFLTYAPEVLEYEAIGHCFDIINASASDNPETNIPPTARGSVWHAKADRAMQAVITQHRAGQDRQRSPVMNTPGRIRRQRPISWFETT